MNKIGLVLDSTSGLTLQEANELGIGFIPHTININGIDYFAGENLDQDKLFDFMKDKDTIIKTTLPNGKIIEKALNESLKNNEKVIVVTMGNKFSGTNNAIRLIAESDERYKGKVFVHHSEFSSPWMNLYARDIIEEVKKYEDPNVFLKILTDTHKYMVGFLSPGDIWWFYKGGRISKMQYMVGSIAKVIPILEVSNGEVQSGTTIKTRGFDKAINKMVELVDKKVNELKLNESDFKYIILKTNSNELVEKTKEIVIMNAQTTEERIVVSQLTTEQCAHMGPNSFGVAVYVPLKKIIEGVVK